MVETQNGAKSSTERTSSDSSALQAFDVQRRDLYLKGLSSEERKRLVSESVDRVFRLMVEPDKPKQLDRFSSISVNAHTDLLELIRDCGKTEFAENALPKGGSEMTEESVNAALVASQVREVKVAQGLQRMMEALESASAEYPRIVLSAASHVPALRDVKFISTEGGPGVVRYPRYNRLFGAVIAQRLACVDGDSPFVEAVLDGRISMDLLGKYIEKLRNYSLNRYPEEERNMLVKQFTSREGIADFVARAKPGGKYPSLWENFRF